ALFRRLLERWAPGADGSPALSGRLGWHPRRLPRQSLERTALSPGQAAARARAAGGGQPDREAARNPAGRARILSEGDGSPWRGDGPGIVPVRSAAPRPRREPEQGHSID